MTQLHSPVGWFGGKGHLQRKLIPLFPAHHLYVEVFGGGASVLCAKPPSAVEVYNDLDSGLVNFFRVLRDPITFTRFERLAALTPYSREEWATCNAEWESETDPVIRAYRWFVVARMSFSGHFGSSWSSVNSFSRGGGAYTAYKWIHTIDALPAVHARLMRAQIEHMDWEPVLERYDSPETLFYLDPPYVLATRGRGGYAHELSDDDHRRLVGRVLHLQGKCIISGYAHPIYTPLEAAGWTRLDFPTHSFATGRTRKIGQGTGSAPTRVETLWFSPNCEGGALQLLAEFGAVNAAGTP